MRNNINLGKNKNICWGNFLAHSMEVSRSAYCGIVFSNYVYLKDMHVILKRFGKILFVLVLRILLIYKFENFTAVFN